MAGSAEVNRRTDELRNLVDWEMVTSAPDFPANCNLFRCRLDPFRAVVEGCSWNNHQ